MNSFGNINIFLLYSRHIILRLSYTNKTRHKIIIWKLKNLPCILSLIAKRNP